MEFLNVRKSTANNGICSNETFFLKKLFVFKLMALLKPYAQPSCLA